MFSICHKPQQPRPACRDRDMKSSQTKWNYAHTFTMKTKQAVPLKVATSPVCALGRPFWQASVVSANVTPQLPNRKPICWLPASWGSKESICHTQRSTTKNRKIQNNFEKGCAEGMWELLMEWKQGNDKKKKKPQSITAASKQQQVSKRSDGQSLLKTLLLCIKARL